MTNLRKSILFMVVYLAVLFNIERLDYSGQNLIDIQSFVYVLITFIILTTLASSKLQSLTAYYATPIWLTVYIALKLLVFSNRPLLGNVYTYLTITEMSFTAVAVLLTYELAHSLGDFETLVERITFPKHGQRIMPLKESGEEIKTEFVRSRRHNRPLSVMVITMDPGTSKESLEQAVKNIQKSMVTRYLLASLAQILTKEARRTDSILEQDDQDGFILLCPETTAEGSCILAERIKRLASERLGISVNCGFAAFPDEALTFEELLHKARSTVTNLEELPSQPYPNPKLIDMRGKEKT